MLHEWQAVVNIEEGGERTWGTRRLLLTILGIQRTQVEACAHPQICYWLILLEPSQVVDCRFFSLYWFSQDLPNDGQ
jgi:hypothetical protein